MVFLLLQSTKTQAARSPDIKWAPSGHSGDKPNSKDSRPDRRRR
jgi:hypothetical protein